LVQRTCDGEEGVRDVEVPACFYLPAMASRRGSLQWLPARRQQSTAQPRLLLPTRAPPLFPPLLFLRRRTGKGQNPNATWPEGGAWPLGCRRGQCGARARTRCALVGWHGGCPDLAAPQWMEPSWGKGRGVFSPWGGPKACTRARPGSAWMPAGGLPVPSRARWCGAVGCGVVRGGEGKGEKEEER
jgi:hypothetical protein